MGESSINILIYVFFLAPGWAAELKERETFIFNVLRLAEKMNIKIAYPTRTLKIDEESKKAGIDVGLGNTNKGTGHPKKTAKKIMEKCFGETSKKPPSFKL